jgi:hypothetical protein
MADKPFYTRFPKGHPDGFCNGVRQAMAWRKLLHGKGSASRGLWHNIAAYLLSLGFTPEVSVDQCLFVHKERQIDFGLYVDDIEASFLKLEEGKQQKLNSTSGSDKKLVFLAHVAVQTRLTFWSMQ